MKIRVEQSELSEAIGWTARTLPMRPATPVLAGVKITASADSLQLSAFDLEVAGQSSVSAVIDEPGVAVVSGRLLADIAKALPAQPVELALDGSRVTVRCGRATFGLPTLPVEDYPALPEIPPLAGEVAAGVFSDAVAQVAIAASRDDTLPVLTGIRVELTADSINMAATDRYRLAVRQIPWQSADPSIDQAALVKAKQLADLGRSLGSTDTVRLALGGDDDGRIGFTSARRELVTRLLSGDFPKYQQLLPSEAHTVAVTNTHDLMESVKRVKLVAAERTTPIRLAFSDGEVLLRAGTGDDAQASESLECSVEGEPIEIAFNPDYLLDGLGVLGDDSVKLSFTTAMKPAVLSGAESGDYRYLLMPVRLGG
ncbi:MAG: DNA polymerase III subunit beta [Actinomycetia bacterium]|nr:DNA polymerase III subunit beta [Actinomycetes bacterium]